MRKNKYNAKSVFWHDDERRLLTDKEVAAYREKNAYQRMMATEVCYFASTFEFRVFQYLVERFNYERVVRQYQVPVLPKTICHPAGKYWTVDFAVKSSMKERPFMYIEVKGCCTEAFLRDVATLELVYPEHFNKMIIVFDKYVPLKHKLIANLRQVIMPRYGNCRKVSRLEELKEVFSTESYQAKQKALSY